MSAFTLYVMMREQDSEPTGEKPYPHEELAEAVSAAERWNAHLIDTEGLLAEQRHWRVTDESGAVVATGGPDAGP